jgi:hypothetical protein
MYFIWVYVRVVSMFYSVTFLISYLYMYTLLFFGCDRCDLGKKTAVTLAGVRFRGGHGTCDPARKVTMKSWDPYKGGGYYGRKNEKAEET